MALGLWGAGHLHRGGIFHRGDEHVATVEEGHHLAVGRHHPPGGPDGDTLGTLGGVGGEGNLHLLRPGGPGGASGHGVYLPVIGESQGAVVGAGEEPHGMGLEIGELHRLRGVVDRELVDVECAAVALREEIHRARDVIQHRVAVFPRSRSQVAVLAVGGGVHPYVAGHRGGVVLAPFILESLHILVKHLGAVGGEGNHLRRGGQHLTRLPCLDIHGVELGHAPRGVHHRRGRGLDGRRIIHLLAVGGESLGNLAGRVGGQAPGRTAPGIHHIYVIVAVAV